MPQPKWMGPGQTGRFPLHGREEELAAAKACLRNAMAAWTGVLLLDGDPGIGKSHVLTRIGADAAQNGAFVLRGGATDIEKMPPFFPFLEILRGLPIVSRRRGRLTGRLAVLADILPELRGRSGYSRDVSALPPEQARLRLLDAIGETLAEAAGRRPLVLLIDDLHWADAAALDALRHLAGSGLIPRLLIVACARPAEAAGNKALASALDHLNRLGVLTRRRLGALHIEHLGAMLTDQSGAAPDPCVLSAVLRYSEGNPFFAREIFRHWADNGHIAKDSGVWRAEAGFAPGGMPPGIVAAIGQRARSLPDTVADILPLASMFGRVFTSDRLAVAREASLDATETELMVAVDAGFLLSGPGGVFEFVHDMVREYFLGLPQPMRRRRLHAAIGATLEAESGLRGRVPAERQPTEEGDKPAWPAPGGTGPSGPNARSAASAMPIFAVRDGIADRTLAALAFHFTHAGDARKARFYCWAAGRSALAAHAPADACRHLEAALGFMSSDDPERVALLLDITDAAGLAGDLTRASGSAREALAIARRRGDHTNIVRAALWLAGAWRASGGTLDESKQLLAPLANSLPPGLERDKIAVLAALADIEAMAGSTADGIRHCTEALTLCEAVGDGRLEAATRHSLAKLVSRIAGRQADGLREAERALRLAVEAGDFRLAAQCCWRVVYAMIQLGQFSQARAVSQQRVRFARRCSDEVQFHEARAWLAWFASWEGDWETVTRLGGELDPVVRRLSDTQPLSFLSRARGYMALMRGDLAGTIAAFTVVSDLLRANAEAIGLTQGLLGLALARAGKLREARAYVTEQERLLAILPPNSVQAAAIVACLAEIALCLNEHERLPSYEAALRPFAGQLHWFLVDRVLARIAMARNDWDAADAGLRGAEAMARRQGLRPELALTTMDRAALLAARGRPDHGLVRAGRAMCETLGIPHGATDTGSMRPAVRAPRDPAVSNTLSARESQVLDLLTHGLANREISERLGISENTTARHLTNIFNKLGVENRVAAAAFALRRVASPA